MLLIVIVLLTGGQVLKAADEEINLCDASVLAPFDGKDVVIKAKLSFHYHGADFVGESCGREAYPGALFDTGEAAAPRVDFRTEVDLLRIVRPFLDRSGWGTVCGTFKGRLFVKNNFRPEAPLNSPERNGFGMRGDPWAFVLRTVSDLRACAP